MAPATEITVYPTLWEILKLNFKAVKKGLHSSLEILMEVFCFQLNLTELLVGAVAGDGEDRCLHG